MAYFETNNQKRLINGGVDLDALGNEATSNLELLAEKIRELEEYRDKIGTTKDTKPFREKMKKKLAAAGEDMIAAKKMITEIDQLNLTKQTEISKRAKLHKRLVELLNERVKNFTDVANQIAKKESQAVEVVRRQSLSNSGVTHSQMLQDQQRATENLVELDMNELEINERQKQIDEIVKITYALRDVTANMAAEIQDQGENLEILVGDIKSSKENVSKTVRELDKASKYKDSQRKTACTLFILVLFACGVIVTLILCFK